MNNEFHYMYPTGQFGSSPMASLGGYSTAAGTPGLMGAAGDQQLAMMQQYAHTPAFSKPSPAPAASMTCSTRIIGDQNSAVYYHDGMNDTLNEHNVRQMITADGSVFVEHITGYSLVYVPNNRPIDQILGGAVSNARTTHSSASKNTQSNAANRANRERTSKPSNAFIMYRNFKIKEMREMNPQINQIDISRMAGDLWKTECDEVKEKFRTEYRKQKQKYDLEKTAGKRTRSDTLDSLSADEHSGAKKSRKNSSATNLGLPGAGLGKPRSRTMPSSVLSSAASRVDYSADLRKHVAARNGSSFLNSPAFDSSDLHQAYAELSATASIADSPSMLGSTVYDPSDMPSLSLGGVQSFSAAGMSVAEQEAIYASQNAAMAAGVNPAALDSSDHVDLTHSFINAGIAAGISTMGNPQDLSISTDASDIATAASIATNNVLTSSFYSETTTPPVEQPDNVQWDHSKQASAAEANEAIYSVPATEAVEAASQ